jgi:hypothetical protein
LSGNAKNGYKAIFFLFSLNFVGLRRASPPIFADDIIYFWAQKAFADDG